MLSDQIRNFIPNNDININNYVDFFFPREKQLSGLVKKKLKELKCVFVSLNYSATAILESLING